jgi:hypothetical protein
LSRFCDEQIERSFHGNSTSQLFRCTNYLAGFQLKNS